MEIQLVEKIMARNDTTVAINSDRREKLQNAAVNITIEALQVDFAQFASDAFNQSPTAQPLSTNGRVFINTDTDVSGISSGASGN